MELRCVHCGFGVKTLFVQYSPGNIRLMKCENCKVVADEYIEWLFVDFIPIVPYVRTLVIIGRTLVFNRSQEDRCLSSSSFSSAWVCGKMLMSVCLGNLTFFYILVVATRLSLRSSSKEIGYIDILLAILVSSYFKILLIAMMVWEFPSSAIFIIDGFVLSSNAVSLKVTHSSLAAVVFQGHEFHYFILKDGSTLHRLLVFRLLDSEVRKALRHCIAITTLSGPLVHPWQLARTFHPMSNRVRL